MNNLFDLNYLKSFLKRSGLKPRDYLGQNFLVDEQALSKLVEASALKPTDTVLEVGPGLGVLTRELISRVKRVIAVEKDQRLSEILQKESRIWKIEHGPKLRIPNSEFKLINQDILKFHISDFITSPYKVVANIPYYLTSKLLQLFLSLEHKPQLIVVMIQKEVGERIIAVPGKLSILGISVQVYADAEIITHVPKTAFWPVPKVDSVILKLTPRYKYPEIKDDKKFFQLVKIAFAGKRKQLKNTLSTYNFDLIEKTGIDLKARPQELSIPDWIKLYLALDKSPEL